MASEAEFCDGNHSVGEWINKVSYLKSGKSHSLSKNPIVVHRDKKKWICEFCQNFYAKSSGYEWKVTNCILNYPTNKFETFSNYKREQRLKI